MINTTSSIGVKSATFSSSCIVLLRMMLSMFDR
jgi:hypothetical protein